MMNRLRPIFFVSALTLSCVQFGCGGEEAAKKEENIKNSDWHYQMAAGYFEANEIPLAIKELTTSLELDNDNHKAHFLMGILYQGRRDYVKALHHYNETLRIEPTFHSARNNRGSVYLATERWRDAEADFTELLDEPLYPTPELAHNNLGWTYYNLKKYPQAIEHYKMAVFLKPGMCLALNNLGLAYLEAKNRVAAAENFQASIQRCPNNYAEPHFHLGKMMQEDRHPEATTHFRRCVEIEPDSNLGRRCRQYLGVH